MSIHNEIVLSADPKGHFIEGILAAGQTPKPGTMLSIISDDTWEVWNGAADGEQDEVVILLDDHLRGKTIDDAYVAGEHFFAYIPSPGDVVKVLCHNVTGTPDAFAIGDKLIIMDGLGKCIVTTGTVEMEPFKVIETVAAITADTLVMCRCTGN